MCLFCGRNIIHRILVGIIGKNYKPHQFLCIGEESMTRDSIRAHKGGNKTCSQEREDIAAVRICVGECAAEKLQTVKTEKSSDRKK